MEQTGDRELASLGLDFLAWSIFDPRAAVARLEQVPVNPKLDLSADDYQRDRLPKRSDSLTRHAGESIWLNFTEMAEFLHPRRDRLRAEAGVLRGMTPRSCD